MGIKALFTYDYGNEYTDKIKEMGYDIQIVHEREISYEDKFKDIEVLVCYHPFERLDISKMKKLKYIQLSSTGFDQVPEKKMKDDMVLCNNKGGYSIAIGEWIVMSILNMLKQSYKGFQRQQEKKWKLNNQWLELYDKKVAFLGTGTLAKEAAKRLLGFGVHITGFNTKGTPVDYIENCFPFENVDEHLKDYDVVVCTLPGTKETNKIIDEKFMSKMKDGVFFINASRGIVVDEKALVKKLKGNKIACAALDVFEEEPLPADNPLWELENVIISSHNSWVSEMRNPRRLVGIMENLKRYAEGRELINKVDINKGY